MPSRAITVVRIIGGRFGGRHLVAPKGKRTRPTSDRAREALFSILGPIDQVAVLDLFAGTGAVGLEALSRGARHVTFVDVDRAACANITVNLDALAIPESSSSVMRVDTRVALARLVDAGASFDLIFSDPPYADAAEWEGRVLRAARRLLPSHGTIVLESRSSARPAEPVEGLALVDERRYGDTAFAFYSVE